MPLPASPDWVVVNAGGHGFYRVQYAPPLLKKLTGALTKLAPIERFNLVSDAFALTQAATDAGGRLPRPHRALRRGDRPQRVDRADRLPRLRQPASSRTTRARISRRWCASGWRGRWSGSAGRPQPERGRARAAAPRRPAPRPRHPRQRPGRAGARPGALRALSRGRVGGGRQRAARPHRDRGRRGRRARVRGVPPALQGRAHAAGGAALPLRAGRLPPAGAGAPDAREDHQRRGAQPGRALPDALAAGGRAQPRARLGLSSRRTGRRWPGSIRAAPIAGCTRA